MKYLYDSSVEFTIRYIIVQFLDSYCFIYNFKDKYFLL